jgi:hypothetical protein
MYSFFAQNFLLPTLAALVAAILFGFLGDVRVWPLRMRMIVVATAFLIVFMISWTIVRFSSRELGSTEGAHKQLIVAGTVVDENNRSVGQATVTVATDDSQHSLSEDNGNFVLGLNANVKPSDRIRIHVTKNGYLPYDGSVQVPTHDFVIKLHRL